MTENPLADYDAQIDALHTEMAPMQARLSAVVSERREYADLLAEETDDPQILMALREVSQVAYTKFVTHVRTTTHEAIWNFNDWRADADDYSTPWLIGPALSIHKDADAAYVNALAASLVDFAARFCPNPPGHLDWLHVEADVSGMMYADVLAEDCGETHRWAISDVLAEDCGETHRWAIFYTPDGSRAALVDQSPYRTDDFEGTLVEVLTRATKVAHNR